MQTTIRQQFLFTVEPEQIHHPYEKWECFKAGFFANKKQGLSDERCEGEYYRILSDGDLFASILERVITNWKFSCEQFLTNESMNRIAWLGQAAVCYESGVPSRYCYAWSKLSLPQQEAANRIAAVYLERWLSQNGRS